MKKLFCSVFILLLMAVGFCHSNHLFIEFGQNPLDQQMYSEKFDSMRIGFDYSGMDVVLSKEIFLINSGTEQSFDDSFQELVIQIKLLSERYSNRLLPLCSHPQIISIKLWEEGLEYGFELSDCKINQEQFNFVSLLFEAFPQETFLATWIEK